MELRRDVFQAIADPTRRAIITLVALHAMTPGAIAENFDSSRQTISEFIEPFRKMWDDRFNKLESIMKKYPKK
jgi:DNA-binding transcriptional ArsR family regulator